MKVGIFLLKDIKAIQVKTLEKIVLEMCNLLKDG